MTIKECVNCPGATDHSTAECPTLRGLLARMVEAYENAGEIDPADLSRARTLLTAQPQASAAQSAPAGERETIRAVFLRNGFTVKDGQTDLKPYVYAAAEELLSIARVSWQRTQSAGVPDAWRDALQKIARHAPPVNCAAKTEVEKLALIAVHALIAFSAPQFSKPTDHQSAKAGTAAPAQPAAQGEHQPVAIVAGHALNEAGEACENTLAYLGNSKVLPLGTKLYTGTAQDQGEVQRLREALEKAAIHVRPTCKALYDELCSVLAASTGQEVKP